MNLSAGELRNRFPKKQKQSRRRRPAKFPMFLITGIMNTRAGERSSDSRWYTQYRKMVPGSEAPSCQRSACHRDCGVGNIRSRRSVLRNFLHRSTLSRHPVSRRTRCRPASRLRRALCRSHCHRRVRIGSRRGRGMRHRDLLNRRSGRAQKIAAGGAAHAAIAIGDAASGEIVIDIHSDITPEMVRQTILARFPETCNIIAKLFSMAVS